MDIKTVFVLFQSQTLNELMHFQYRNLQFHESRETQHFHNRIYLFILYNCSVLRKLNLIMNQGVSINETIRNYEH